MKRAKQSHRILDSYHEMSCGNVFIDIGFPRRMAKQMLRTANTASKRGVPAAEYLQVAALVTRNVLTKGERVKQAAERMRNAPPHVNGIEFGADSHDAWPAPADTLALVSSG